MILINSVLVISDLLPTWVSPFKFHNPGWVNLTHLNSLSPAVQQRKKESFFSLKLSAFLAISFLTMGVKKIFTRDLDIGNSSWGSHQKFDAKWLGLLTVKIYSIQIFSSHIQIKSILLISGPLRTHCAMAEDGIHIFSVDLYSIWHWLPKDIYENNFECYSHK